MIKMLKIIPFRRYNTLTIVSASPSPSLSCFENLCNLVSTPVGSLDELETKLDECQVPLTPTSVVELINNCKDEAPTRRLLRFFTWSCKNLGSNLSDNDFNHAIRVFAAKRDDKAVDILMSDLRKDARAMDFQTFKTVAEMMVKLGREGDALGIFKNLKLFKCPQDGATVVAIVNALCSKGHARRAEGVLYHHRKKLSGLLDCVYRSILYGWCVQIDVKEARKTLEQMKFENIALDVFCFNTYLKCLCEHNLKKNPSAIVPEGMNLFMEMRTHKVVPNLISYNILLSSLCRGRRVKEPLKIFDSMKNEGCCPDWVSYYIVIRVLYMTGRFEKGNEYRDTMFSEGLVPPAKFYKELVGLLCRVGSVHFALPFLDHMKKNSVDGYRQVYNVLIPNICRAGDFEKGKQLWDEAEEMGIALWCSRDVLDPSVTEVSQPGKKKKDLKDAVSINDDGCINSPVGIIEKRSERGNSTEAAKKRWQRRNNIGTIEKRWERGDSLGNTDRLWKKGDSLGSAERRWGGGWARRSPRSVSKKNA